MSDLIEPHPHCPAKADKHFGGSTFNVRAALRIKQNISKVLCIC